MFNPAKDLPDKFEVGKLVKGTENFDPATQKNFKWVAKLGSQSYGNPTIANGRVYIGTNNDSPRDKRHLGDRSILLCLDEKTGEMHWQLVVPKLKSGKVNDWESLGLLSSPTVIGDRLYVVSSRCEVLCLDVNGQANGNDGAFKDEVISGVQVHFTDPARAPLTALNYHAMEALRKVAGRDLFAEAVKRMVSAFEGRARQLYGVSAPPAKKPSPAP